MFATVSIERLTSVPFLPWTRVRMKMIRSPFLPEIRAQSSGFVVFGRSSFSELIDARGQQVVDPDALLPGFEEILDCGLLRTRHHVLEHRSGVEVLEVEDFFVAICIT